MSDKWHEDLLLIADFIPPNPDEMQHFDVAAQIRDIRDLGFNAQHIEVTDVTVGEAGITYFESSVAIEQRRDLLKEYRQGYSGTGAHDLIYFNVHWLSESLLQTHPEWFQIYENQQIIPISYGVGGYSCINSPFRDWAFQMISDIGKYGVQGIFLDGPVFNQDGCYCEGCLQRFESRYGYRYNAGQMKNRQVRQQVLRFKHESIAEFVREARAALTAANPDAIIYMNGLPLGPSTCGRSNRVAVQHQDMLLAEGGFLSGDLRTLPIWKPAASAKFLEAQAGGKPYVVAIAGRNGPWNRYLLTAAETWIAYAMSVANGANIWYGIYDTNRTDERMKTVREINHFLTAHGQYFARTSSTANIALVWSMKNANFYQTTTEHWDFVDERSKRDEAMKSDARKAFNGWFEVLSRFHAVFDIIDDDELTQGSLSRYELVILPGIACLSGAESEKLTQYVADGGHLIATYDTSCYDELGVHLPSQQLADVLGIDALHGTVALPFDHIEVEPCAFTRGIDQAIIPAPALCCQVVPRPGTKTCMALRERQKARYCDLPARTAYPLITAAGYGRGQAVLFTGNVDAEYDIRRIPEYYTLMSNAINQLSTRKVSVRNDASALFLNMRRRGQSLIVHLVNYTTSYGRPLQNILPLQNLDLQVQTAQKPGRVFTLRGGRELDFTWQSGLATFTVPEIQEYEVVIIE